MRHDEIKVLSGPVALEKGRSRVADRDACMECGACARNCPADVLWVQNGVGCATGILNAALGRKSACCGEETKVAEDQQGRKG